jgi:hypothetical protein
MTSNRIAAVIALLAITIAAGILFSFQRASDRILTKQKPEVHYHAGFRVYIDGELQDFSDIKYMNVKPCESEDHKDNESAPPPPKEAGSEEETAHEEAVHLHDLVGDVVHIHASGVRWEDLFTYLESQSKESIPREPIVAYNGQTLINDPLDSPIKAYQSMTFFVGAGPSEAEKEEILSMPLTKEYIIKIEKQGELCGTDPE